MCVCVCAYNSVVCLRALMSSRGSNVGRMKIGVRFTKGTRELGAKGQSCKFLAHTAAPPHLVSSIVSF